MHPFFIMSQINFRVQFKNLESYLDLIDKFDVGLEIVLNFTDINRINIDEINSYKIPNLTIHAPFFDVSLGSLNSYVADLSSEILGKTIEIANSLNTKHLVMHHNYQPYYFAFNEDLFVDNFSKNFYKILSGLNGNYKILLENVFETTPNIGYKIKERFSDNELVGFCFDVGHFNLFSEFSIEEWFEIWSPYIYEFHLHDNNGVYDEHLAIGKGKIDFKRILNLHIAEVLTIENTNKSDLIYSYNKLKELLDMK